MVVGSSVAGTGAAVAGIGAAVAGTGAAVPATGAAVPVTGAAVAVTGAPVTSAAGARVAGARVGSGVGFLVDFAFDAFALEGLLVGVGFGVAFLSVLPFFFVEEARMVVPLLSKILLPVLSSRSDLSATVLELVTSSPWWCWC